MLSQINYWTDLGFDENVEKGGGIKAKLKGLKKKRRTMSMAKNLYSPCTMGFCTQKSKASNKVRAKEINVK